MNHTNIYSALKVPGVQPGLIFYSFTSQTLSEILWLTESYLVLLFTSHHMHSGFGYLDRTVTYMSDMHPLQAIMLRKRPLLLFSP